jgi:hypothetical protein
MAKNEKEAIAELKEATPSAPVANTTNKTIIYHGTLYAFPAYNNDQIEAMKKEMESINLSYSYSKLCSLLTRIKPFRVGPARSRKPGALVAKKLFVIETERKSK